MIKITRGNCLEVLPEIPSGSIDLVFADLPYGVTANKWDSRIDLANLWSLLLQVAKPNAAFIFTATQPFATVLINSQTKLFRYDIVWDKGLVTGHLNANRMPMRRHESILMFYRVLPTYKPQKTIGRARKDVSATTQSSNYGNYRPCRVTQDGWQHPTSIIGVPNDADRFVGNWRRQHPTQKPVALLEWLIKTYSNPGDIVLDPTMGSGTTGVACVTAGRQFHGIELDATYYKTAKRRIREALG